MNGGLDDDYVNFNFIAFRLEEQGSEDTQFCNQFLTVAGMHEHFAILRGRFAIGIFFSLFFLLFLFMYQKKVTFL